MRASSDRNEEGCSTLPECPNWWKQWAAYVCGWTSVLYSVYVLHSILLQYCAWNHWTTMYFCNISVLLWIEDTPGGSIIASGLISDITGPGSCHYPAANFTSWWPWYFVLPYTHTCSLLLLAPGAERICASPSGTMDMCCVLACILLYTLAEYPADDTLVSLGELSTEKTIVLRTVFVKIHGLVLKLFCHVDYHKKLMS